MAPTIAAVHDKSYPLARSLHLYTLGEPQGAVKAYIDWILSPAGQKVVEDAGYVPVAVAGNATGALATGAPAPAAPPAPATSQSKP